MAGQRWAYGSKWHLLLPHHCRELHRHEEDGVTPVVDILVLVDNTHPTLTEIFEDLIVGYRLYYVYGRGIMPGFVPIA